MKDRSEMTGRVCLVTGGANGIGAATARLLAQRGAVVIVADLRPPTEDQGGAQLSQNFLTLDVADESGWKSTMEQVMERHGRLDVLVNAAGIVGDVLAGTLELTTLEEWRRVLAVNLDGTFLGCREAMRAMQRHGTGSIVNVASVGAYYPTTQSVAYGASKGAVTQLTKSVAFYGAQDGHRIRCNSVHPGRTATRMLETIVAQKQQRAIGSGVEAPPSSASRIPLGPEGQPEDAASVIAFLASDESRYVTGSEYVVDGGWCLLR